MREQLQKTEPAAPSSNSPAPFDYGVFIDLNEQAIRMFDDGSVKEEAGRKSKMLVKYPEFRIVLVTMRAGSRWNEHKTPSRIFVQVLRGHILFRAPHATFNLRTGQLLTLDPGIAHSVDSTGDSAFLLTLSGPASQ
jgi:quercetin dioxygenase-like cupin family protein